MIRRINFCKLLVLLTLIILFIIPGRNVFASEVPSITNDYQMLPGETTSARLSIENYDSISHSYSLAFEQMPTDFHGYFMLDGKVTQKIDLMPSHKSILTFSIDVPSNVSLDNLLIPLLITRDDGVKETLAMSYTLNQDYHLSISSNVSLMKAINGDSINLELGVTNTGNKDLADLTPQIELPYKWILTSISPATLNIKSGDTGLYEVKITVPASQQAGEYPVKISCSNSVVTSNELSVPVAVSTSINYFWWVAGLVVLLTVFTIFYFKKHGRR